MSVEVIVYGIILLLIGGWILVQFVTRDPIESWKQDPSNSPTTNLPSTPEPPLSS